MEKLYKYRRDANGINIIISKEYIRSLYNVIVLNDKSVISLTHELYKDDWTTNTITVSIGTAKSIQGVSTNSEPPILIHFLINTFDEYGIKGQWENFTLGTFNKDSTLEDWIKAFKDFHIVSKKWKSNQDWIFEKFNRPIDILVE